MIGAVLIAVATTITTTIIIIHPSALDLLWIEFHYCFIYDTSGDTIQEMVKEENSDSSVIVLIVQF
jgi:hypothetical protein